MKPESDILEHNVSTLLESGGEPPRLDADARERVKTALVARFAAPQAVATPARVGRPLIAVGVGLAALAAGALIVARGRAPGAPTPEHMLAKLTDGTTYIADAGAHLTVLGPRRVRVDGAVLLDVAPGQGTFVVETVRGRVEVLGTKFVVDGEADQTSAAVIRGEVKLASDTGDVTLHAGEQGVATAGKAPVRGPAPRLSHLVSWAREARHADDLPVHHGTLFARDPGVRSHPPWGQEYPLPIKQLTLDVVVEDQVARVAMDQTFHNAEPQDLEGVYRFAIPPDAALQRLAMYVDGQLEESAVVERMQARRIYEQLVYRRVDPALLEWAGAGRLALRVYPIPAQSDKRLVLAYTQSLPKLYDDWTLTIPLPEVDQPVGNLDATIRVKGCANCELASPSHAITVERAGDDAVVHYHRANDKIGDSLVLHVRDSRHATTFATKTDGDDRYLMVRATPELGAATTTYRPRTWVILDDVSASRGTTELEAQRDLVDALVKELDENDRVAVIAFDVQARMKLPPTRVMTVDRRALRASLEHEGGIGATDFEVALDAAVQALDGVSPDDAMIVYLGDGMVTSGPRNLDALRARIVGKAHFVGVGVGDGPDTQTLGDLAAATGGYATTFDLADDLGWRAFDLVAALHTQRVTQLDARLVDASGATVPATAYLDAPQLADGEELELVAKLAGSGTPVAVELSGVLNGAPWRSRIALASPTTPDAGYLPRLWAQRHIAARLLAKHEPVPMPPCTSTKTAACPSEGELREARDEQIRREVVALGKRYFLLSRHTSLLVLENDAMYAQFGVAKGRGDTWAQYSVPERWQAPVEANKNVDVPPVGGELVRTPISDEVFAYANDASSATIDAPVGALRLDEGKMGKRDWDETKAFSAVVTAGPIGNVGTGEIFDRRGGEFEGGMDGTLPAQSEALRQIAVFGHGAGVGHGTTRGGIGWYGLGPTSMTRLAATELDDVTSFVPALFPDDVDAIRAELARSTGPHALDPAAKLLLDQARAALPAGVYRWGDRELAVDARHGLGWRTTTDDDLAETAAYDGNALRRRYAELGIDVTRVLGDDDVALGFARAPFWIADPAHYARFFDVTANGRDVTLSARVDGHAQVAYVLTFDAQARLVAIHDGTGQELVAITWGATGPVAARVGGEAIEVGGAAQPIADASAWAEQGTTPGVAVTLPAHQLAFWDQQLAHLAAGSAAWRDAERQVLVSAAATRDRVRGANAFEALRGHGGVELGDVALASAALVAMQSSAQLRATLGPLSEQPLGAYLVGMHGKPEAPAVAHIGLVGALVQARAAIDAAKTGAGDRAVAELAALGNRALGLRIVVASATQYAVAPALAARLWDACATGRFTNTARMMAVELLEGMGQPELGADEISRLVDGLDLSAPPPDQLVSYLAYITQTRRGDAGRELVVAHWRDKVLAGDSFAHVMALLQASAMLHDPSPVFAKAVALAGTDPVRGIELARLAIQVGQPAWVDRVVAPLLARAPSRALYQLAAQSAIATGRPADALADLEKAQDISGDPAPIADVRVELGSIVGLAQQLALAASGPARDQLVARALRWGDRWRAIDPGNVEIDRQLGDLLLSVGDEAGAWRQLSSMIERDPWSGAGYSTVAQVYEQQGKLEQALPFWQQAIVIDQTNPTPRLRKAQALIALGRSKEGDVLLHDITSQKWHDVWGSVVEQAHELSARH